MTPISSQGQVHLTASVAFGHDVIAAARDLASGQLIDLFPEHDVAATEFDTGAWLLHLSRSYLPARTRVVVDLLRKGLRQA